MLISLKVSARSKQNKIVKISDAEYKVYVTAAPERGKANEKVIELLAEYFKIPKSDIRIIKGAAGHHKMITISPS